MTQQSKSIEPHLLRRVDQVILAAILVLGITVWLNWWTFQSNRQATFVEVEQAQPHSYAFKVDLNHAAWPELAQLPRIGELTARKIVASREDDGPFANIKDLQRIRGIGLKTVARIRPYLLPVEGHNSAE